MGPTLVLVVIVAVAAIAVLSALTVRRSPAVAALNLAGAILFAGLAYYAHVESQSLPWTVGYLAAAVVCLVLAVVAAARSAR